MKTQYLSDNPLNVRFWHIAAFAAQQNLGRYWANSGQTGAHQPRLMSTRFGAIAKVCGLTHIRDVKAFVSKVMVFDKPLLT